MQMAIKEEQEQLARPLKVLVPLIQDEIKAGYDAGLEHYRRAGEMLIEAKSQLERGEWNGWLKRHFELSPRTAGRYMDLVPLLERSNRRQAPNLTMSELLEENTRKHQSSWSAPVREVLHQQVRPSLQALAQERQNKEKELQLSRKLAHQLINIGYKVLATQLHPDKPGGSAEAMARLNRVRNILKDAI
jgi:hypothetical protein